MFKSIELIMCLGYNEETNLFSYECGIVDTTFTEVAVSSGVGAEAVINAYSKRNLNVSLNLLLYMRYIEHRYSLWPMPEQIKVNRHYTPEFSKYENDINKYLSLL